MTERRDCLSLGRAASRARSRLFARVGAGRSGRLNPRAEIVAERLGRLDLATELNTASRAVRDLFPVSAGRAGRLDRILDLDLAGVVAERVNVVADVAVAASRAGVGGVALSRAGRGGDDRGVVVRMARRFVNLYREVVVRVSGRTAGVEHNGENAVEDGAVSRVADDRLRAVGNGGPGTILESDRRRLLGEVDTVVLRRRPDLKRSTRA